MIPILDLTEQYRSLKSELDAAVQAVAASGHHLLGPVGKALEAEVAAYRECRHGVGLANGTDALHRARARRDHALLEGLAGLELPNEIDGVQATYRQHTMRLSSRDRRPQLLAERGVQTMVHYPVPLHLQEVLAALGHRRGDFPEAAAAADGCLSPPMYPELAGGAQQQAVAQAVRDVLQVSAA